MEISATEFKARCLDLMDRVNMTGERIQVTKRGKIVAELGPPAYDKKPPSGPGVAKGKMRIVGDIMAPLDVEWDALK